MKVYRYLSEDELNSIKLGNFDKIGNEFDRKFFKNTNTHKYKKGIKYLHFFKEKKDISHIKRYYQGYSGKFYVCTFDIPLKILVKGYGKAKYEDGWGYDIFVVKRPEFIVPALKMQKEWLIKVEDYVTAMKEK